MLIDKRLLMLWLVIQLSLLALLNEGFSLWISAIYVLLLLYLAVQVLQNNSTASLTLANILSGLIAVALVINARQAGVLHFMLQILLLAAIARLFALKHLHEARQLIWVHYFLIACCFIMHQDMVGALLILSLFAANLYSQYRLFAPRQARLNIKLTGRAILIILPLWLGMFLLFPRLAPLWQIPSAKMASTGLSDMLDPGSIEQLVQDNSLAFRVEFATALPQRQQLYWRSYLYEDFDGRRWQVNAQHKDNRSQQNAAAPSDSKLSEYRVIAEASQQHNLYALGSVYQHSANVELVTAQLIRSPKLISQRFSYQLTSDLQAIPLQSEPERRRNLQLAPGNPATRQFALELQQRYPQPNELVAAIANHFRQQPFYYSLKPPALGRDSVDQFLFQTRTGFCSHYASATALLLRHAGIPARVVGGYLGGDWHAEQGYLAVRQREAHAWVEYLQQGQWLRFDPTAAVAPQRVLDSLDMALPENERDMLHSPWQSLAIIQLLSQQLMHLDYYWSVWVLGFDDTQQQNLWHVLRKHWPAILYTMAALLLLSLCIGLLLWYRRTRLNRPAIAQQLVLRALKPLLAAKPTQQSVSGYLQQLATNHPAYADALLKITEQYDLAVYANQPQAEQELRKRLKHYQQQFKQLNRLIQNT